MKKSLIALAVMAAAGAASAQSSVQLYGIADVWFGTSKVEDGAGKKIYDVNGNGVKFNQTQLTNGGVSNSRWGLKGSEDLGGGLKAVFTLEQGFSLDDGSSTGGFNREATVGLTGSFGTVKLGKQFNAFDDVSGAASTLFDSDLAPINNVFESTSFADNYANTVKYISPAFSGFSGSASYSFGEDKTDSQSATKNYALAGQYANGPLALGVGYAVAEKHTGGDFWNGKATRLNGSYDLGVATLKASYGHVSYDDNWKTNEYEFGVDYPVASNLILSAGYAVSNQDDADGKKDAEVKGFGVAAAYLLSKRTTVYAGATQATTEDADGVDTAKKTIYAIGVKHAF
jgi:predicted porin